MLESHDSPASQYWATWALANLTKVYRKFFLEKKFFFGIVFIFVVFVCICVCACVCDICESDETLMKVRERQHRSYNAEALEPFNTLSYTYNVAFFVNIVNG